jgi:hypothetical protein
LYWALWRSITVWRPERPSVALLQAGTQATADRRPGLTFAIIGDQPVARSGGIQAALDISLLEREGGATSSQGSG